MARSIAQESLYERKQINALYLDKDGKLWVEQGPGKLTKLINEYSIFKITDYKADYSVDFNSGHMEVTI